MIPTMLPKLCSGNGQGMALDHQVTTPPVQVWGALFRITPISLLVCAIGIGFAQSSIKLQPTLPPVKDELKKTNVRPDPVLTPAASEAVSLAKDWQQGDPLPTPGEK